MIIAYILITIGLILTLFNLPGIWVVFSGILLSSFINGFQDIGVLALSVLFTITLLTGFLDNLAIIWGAKKFGATKWGMLGAFVGAIVGFIIGNIPGVILGPFLGAFLFEIMIAKKESDQAFRAGIGTLVGIFLSVVLKFVVALTMAYYWYSQIQS